MPGLYKSTGKLWDIHQLFSIPRTWEDTEHRNNDVKALFFEGLPWKGRETRVFAHYGIPRIKSGERCPAMVLAHGGGGSAFSHWVRLWVSRGFAAISMDTCGCINGGGHDNHPRHDYGGPAGWGDFKNVDATPEDQWPYHAVADVVLAHSLIRSFPQVDPNRVGLTGVSWGGYLTCIAAGIDPRFCFAAPVYGCGYLRDNSFWIPEFQKMGTEKAERWSNLWDPSQYLPDARMPMLWVTGTNDFAYPMDSLKKSYRLPAGERTLSVRVNMEHNHPAGEQPAEIGAFAESILAAGEPLARITGSGISGRKAWITFESCVEIKHVEFNFTRDTGNWQERHWEIVSVALDSSGGRAAALLPEGTTTCFFNLIDKRDLVVSSEHQETGAEIT